MPAKLDRCVADVKKDPGVDEPYAVCNASIKELDSIAKKFVNFAKCQKCGKSEDEHGMFTDHDYEEIEELPEEDEEAKSITITFNEAFSIGGNLSAQSVGGKKIEECEPCSLFNKTHKALMQETGLTESHEGDLDRILEADDPDTKWITVSGNHIPIKKGQSKDEAVKNFLSKQKGGKATKAKGGGKSTTHADTAWAEPEFYEGKLDGKKHGRIATDDPAILGYHKENWENSSAGRKQVIMNYLDRNPKKKFNPYSTLPENMTSTDKTHPTVWEQDAMSLINEGYIKSTGAESYKLAKPELRAQRRKAGIGQWDKTDPGYEENKEKETESSLLFNKVHEALMKESHNPMDIPVGHEVDEGGPGSGPKGGTKTFDYETGIEVDPSQNLKRPPIDKNYPADWQSGAETSEGGPGSGIKGHTTPKDDEDNTGGDWSGWGPEGSTARSRDPSFKSNPKVSNLQKISDVYNDLESQIDPDLQGDYSGYSDQIINDTAAKHGISPEQAQEVWDSGGTTDIDLEGGGMPQEVPPEGGASQPTDMEHVLANLGTIGTDTVSPYDMTRLQSFNPAIEQGFVDSKMGKDNQVEFYLTAKGKKASKDVLAKFSDPEVPDAERGYQAPDDPEAIELHRLEDEEKKDHADES